LASALYTGRDFIEYIKAAPIRTVGPSRPIQTCLARRVIGNAAGFRIQDIG
jgi:hypothetical protein